MGSRYPWFIGAAGALLVGLSAFAASLGDLTRAIPAFLLAFAGMYAAYMAAVFMLLRARAPGRAVLGLVFVVAVASRGAGLAADPSLSNDVYRYLWEGRVVKAGFNPFAYAPEAPELSSLRDADYERINHKHLPSIYPPAAQGAFYLGALIHPSVIAQKIVFVLFDLATIAILVLLLRARGLSSSLCAIYAWNPLVIVEFAHSGHMDSLGIFLLVLGVFCLHMKNHLLGFTSVALSFLAKYFSVALLPFFVFKKRYLLWVGFVLSIAVAGYLPFADAAGGLFGSLETYGRHWHFNSLVFETVRRVAEPGAVRWMLTGALAAFALILGYRSRDVLRYTYRVVGCALILLPTVYPWYVCWIIPFLCFYTRRAWLYLSGSVVLSYLVWPRFHANGRWEVGWEVLLVEYIPFAMLLFYDGYRAMSSRRRASS
jgi:hypothetical protein